MADQIKNFGKDIDTEEWIRRRWTELAFVKLNDQTPKEIVNDLFGNDPKKQFIAVQTTRKILSRERHPHIDNNSIKIIEAGIVPRCIEFLKNPASPDLQFEAARMLTNIASGSSIQTNVVVKAGAIEPFIELLRSPFPHIAEQAVWALGIIAEDGPVLRDTVIDKGIVPTLVALVKGQTNPSFLRNVAWTLSNLCRTNNPALPPEATKQCLPALAKLIQMTDIEIVSDACCALSYLSDGPEEKIEEVVKSGVVVPLVTLLDCGIYDVVRPCLRAVGNIVTGSDTQTQSVVKSGVLPLLAKLLSSPYTNIVKEAAWTVSNIAAGTLVQIHEVLYAGIVPLLINVLHSGDFPAQTEAAWAITNITSGGHIEHMIHLCEHGAIPAMCNMLGCTDWRTIIVVLDGLENLLKGAQEIGQIDRVACAIEECGGLHKIEWLQSHDNDTVYNKAYFLIDAFFSDEGADHENLQPEINSSGDFQLSTKVPEGGFKF